MFYLTYCIAKLSHEYCKDVEQLLKLCVNQVMKGLQQSGFMKCTYIKIGIRVDLTGEMDIR